MGFFSQIRRIGNVFSSWGHARPQSRRACRFEQMERRQLLSVAPPVHLGMTYFEDQIGADHGGDVFELTWSGGAAGTQLVTATIETDKLGDGLTPADCFFDTASGGRGTSGFDRLKILDHAGIDSVDFSVADGGTTLVFTFAGFDPGERLRFTVDVDEQGFINPNAVAEGAEFEGSKLSGRFTAPHFYDATGDDIFLDDYQANLDASGLNLPPNSYTPADPKPVQTAGAFVTLAQTPLPISLAGTVFEDVNLNNRQEPGDRGIAGVQLALWRLEGTTYLATGKTTSTDAQGHYRFEGLLPGTYRVAEVQPAGYYSVGAAAGNVGGATRGVVTDVDTLSQIELVGGEDSVANDFAEAAPAALSGRVYHDADNDGVFDTGEQPIGGAIVRVYYLGQEGAAPVETRSAADGSWSVGNLRPGDYRVEEVTPAGYLDGLDAAGSHGGTAENPGDRISGIHLPSGAAGIHYDFGELVPATIRGRVIADANGNSRIDAGDTFIPSVIIKLLDASGRVVATTSTNAQGEYEFTGLAPGVYGVEEVHPAGYLDSVDKPGSVGGSALAPDSIIDVVLASATNAVDYDFYEILYSSLRGQVVVDANGNQAIDAGEVPISGVTIRLRDSAGKVVATTATDAQGRYEFVQLPPGTYTIDEVQPAGYYDGADLLGTLGGQVANDSFSQVTLISGTHGQRYDFLELLPSQISGYVVADANANGQIDEGESPIAGVTVHLISATGDRLASTTTNAAGYYAFKNLAPGVYGVEEIQPANYYDGQERLGSAGGSVANDRFSGIRLVSATDAVHYDFLEIMPSRISGHVAVDGNNNGLLDPNEKPIAGVTIHLLNEAGERIATTTTNTAGYYEFKDLAPGLYGVEEQQPEGYYDGADRLGSAGGQVVPPDSLRGIRLVSGTDGANYDFLELEPVSLSGYVYADNDNDGQKDAGEEGIAGVKLTLLDAQGNATTVTAITDGQGFYRFDRLAPGQTYGVAESQPEGYLDGLDAAGTAGGAALNPGDRITAAHLKAGVHGKNYNFGEIKPARFCGRVYQDLDGDGTFDPAEPAIPGVTVYLLDASGTRIASTSTNAEGRYCFTDLYPGSYGVEEIQPAGYYQGKTYVGTAGGERLTDKVLAINLGPGAWGQNYDFTELVPAMISGRVFQDGPTIYYERGTEAPDPHVVRDGVFTPDDKPIAGVTMKLGDASGAAILVNGREVTTVTDQNGYYQFTGLDPNTTYTVLEVQPEGYVDSVDREGTNGGVAINVKRGDSVDPMQVYSLAVDPKNDAIIRIFVASGDRATAYNFSEVRIQEAGPEVPFFPPERAVAPPPAIPGMPYGEPSPPMITYVPAADIRVLMPMWGGGSQPAMYSWHLSVVNGGRPRRDQKQDQALADYANLYFDPVSWTGNEVDGGEWTLADAKGTVLQQLVFGIDDAIPVTGDFDGDGQTEIGVYSQGLWFLDLNGNGRWDAEDLWAKLGRADDLPVVGDWDGDGKDDIGVFGPSWEGDGRAIRSEPGLPDVQNNVVSRPKNLPPGPEEAVVPVRTMKRTRDGNFRSDVIDHVFQYGSAGDIAVAGDWNGDGVANIGLYRSGVWYLDVDGNGVWSSGDAYLENAGGEGDLPVVGDWNGDGIDEIGTYRDGFWRIDSNHDYKLDSQDRSFQLGSVGDRPAAGDFDGDGTDEPAVYHNGRTRADRPVDRQADAGDAQGDAETSAQAPAERVRR